MIWYVEYHIDGETLERFSGEVSSRFSQRLLAYQEEHVVAGLSRGVRIADTSYISWVYPPNDLKSNMDSLFYKFAKYHIRHTKRTGLSY